MNLFLQLTLLCRTAFVMNVDNFNMQQLDNPLRNCTNCLHYTSFETNPNSTQDQSTFGLEHLHVFSLV